jgi:hypothetical protein
MPNRGQSQDQNRTRPQKGRQNPETNSPDDEEALQGDQTQMAGQQQPRRRRGGDQQPDEPLGEMQQEEDEADEDEEGNEGSNRPS